MSTARSSQSDFGSKLPVRFYRRVMSYIINKAYFQPRRQKTDEERGNERWLPVPAPETRLRNQVRLFQMSVRENADRRTRKSALGTHFKGSDPHPDLLKEQTQQNRWVELGCRLLVFISCALCVDRMSLLSGTISQMSQDGVF